MNNYFDKLPIEVRKSIDDMINGKRPTHVEVNPNQSIGVGIEMLFLAASYYKYRLNN